MTWPKSVKATIGERSQGVCEGCGERRGENIHHRKFKSRGGENTVENAILLCGFGNSSGCHGRAHSGDGAELGWAVPRYARPELWPAHRFGVGWVIYDNDGGWQEITESTAEFIMSNGGRT